MRIYNYLLQIIEQKGAAYLVLLDPDKLTGQKLAEFVLKACKAGVDAFLFGGSLLVNGTLDEQIKIVKEHSSVPVILFPGSESQITPAADAILFLSLISGRNPDHLIGKHVIAAPILKKIGLEPIPTGYVLVESGKRTTAEYMSASIPIPRHKPEIAAATALAGEYLGLKIIYLEAGSGAEASVPIEMVRKVTSVCTVPVIVGGGIRDTKSVTDFVNAGAKCIVTGNLFEDESRWGELEDFARAVHIKEKR
ncbi:MAG: geranylgeranylglyceryl/heptaprenylglyceryl phosphate synthase [Ignavibacteria bacterium]|nr:geranylgeranylglyceryl/heptaprenylglyceryl phosphate synthase [Ignavibacteria bacterium]